METKNNNYGGIKMNTKKNGVPSRIESFLEKNGGEEYSIEDIAKELKIGKEKVKAALFGIKRREGASKVLSRQLRLYRVNKSKKR